MEFGIALNAPISLEKLHNHIKELSKFSFDHLFVGEMPPVSNSLVRMSTILSLTENWTVWSGITSPFYYNPDVFLGIIETFNQLFQGRFGIGLGIGNLKIIRKPEIVRRPFTNFKERVLELKEKWTEIQAKKSQYQSFPPLAIGGLGNKMCRLARDHADVFLLNSASGKDIERCYKIIHNNSHANCKLFSYVMIQIVDKVENISGSLWNILKEIASFTSIHSLKERGYSAKEIEIIKALPKKWGKKLPSKEKISLLQDFAIIGNEQQVQEKLDDLHKYIKAKKVDGVVISIFADTRYWDDLKLVYAKLKK